MLNKAFAFIKKDFLITVSYKIAFVLQLVSILVMVALFYYVGKFVEKGANPLLNPYGGNYFAFILIGAAFADYVGISINAFSSSIRDGQLTGTLEIMVLSPTRLSTILLCSSLWSYLFTTFRIVVYLSLGILFFGLNLSAANIQAAITLFLLSISCFASLGMIVAAFTMAIKKGEAILALLGSIGFLLSGLLFPVEALPEFLLNMSKFIPMTYSLRGIRLALLQGYSLQNLRHEILSLAAFSLVFLPLGLAAFGYAVKKAKVSGTLTQY